MTNQYDESSIERFAGLSGIRKKPTPYIGPTDSSGLWTIWRELADNCVDQCLAGRNNLVHLIQDEKPNVYWCLDAGPGIPVGFKVFENERGVKEKLSTLYVATGLTHGGANFGKGTVSRGTHGLGQKATNAMSKEFQVWTFREGSWHTISYQQGKLVSDVSKCRAPKLPFGIKATKGTITRFSPDLPLFHKGASMPPQFVRDWCKLTSYLVPGITVRYTNKLGKTVELKSKGPKEYLETRIAEGKCAVTGKPFVFSSKSADVAVAFTDTEGDSVLSYTNGLFNKEGGEHHRALTDSLVKALLPYSKKDKSGKLKYTPSDIKDGLLGLVNYKIAAPQFNNQPKDKLIDDRVYASAYAEFLEEWTKFFNANKTLARQIIDRAETLREKTSDFLKDKKLVKNVNAAKRTLKTKLAGLVGRTPVDQTEVLLVEGDSAAGGVCRARNRAFQAVYPLKGKPLNVQDCPKEKVNANEEVVGLIAAIGNNEGVLNYGKIILFADADVDGLHINSLLLGFLWKFFPQAFKQQKVFVVKSPLYKCWHKGKNYFGETQEEVWSQTGTKNVELTYLKGWGEVNETDLVIALDPNVRQLYRVNPPKDKKSASDFELLLGKSPAFRKKLLNVE